MTLRDSSSDPQTHVGVGLTLRACDGGDGQTSAVRGVSDLREVATLPLQQTWGRTSWLGPQVSFRALYRHVYVLLWV